MSNYVELNGNNEIVAYPYTFSNLQEENPYTNFGDNSDVAYWFPQTNLALTQGYQLFPVLYSPQPTFDPLTQYVAEVAPTLVDGQWYQTWAVCNNTPEQQAACDADRRQANKQQASNRLTQTDWTAIPSVADPAQSNPYLANQAEFLSYRSQIRAIAINPPVVVESWPVEPDEVWATVTP